MRLEKRVNLIYKDYLELDKPREFQKEGITMVSDKPKKMLILNILDNKVFFFSGFESDDGYGGVFGL